MSRAYTLIDLLVFVALLAILAGLIAYSPRRQGCRAQRLTCVNNLNQIGLSFKQWALDSQDRFPTQVPVTIGGTLEFVNSGAAWVHFRTMSNELNTPKVLICPQERNKNRMAATTFATAVSGTNSSAVPFASDTNVSYFVGVDAQDIYPQMWLSGDANLATRKIPVAPGLVSLGTNRPVTWNDSRHGSQGNICFADGSVRQLPGSGLVASLRTTGDPTNRLAMP